MLRILVSLDSNLLDSVVFFVYLSEVKMLLPRRAVLDGKNKNGARGSTVGP